MLDFTKDELECLENAIQIQLAERAMSQINFDRRVELRDKIQSMIDNYWEHEFEPLVDNYAIDSCHKCGVVK